MIGAFQGPALRGAVAALCPDIQTLVDSQLGQRVLERQLWWEFSCCILSSQVPFPTAAAAASRIDRAGVLIDSTPRDVEGLRSRLHALLREPLEVDGRNRRYRFPGSRADQLSRAWGVIREEHGSLSSLVNGSRCPSTSREWLVARVPGLGPKQASMFLRNMGVSYELAVLDRHVLTYMSAVGLCGAATTAVGKLSAYERHESVLRGHAEEIGYPVGLVDWAIWIVMRAASELTSEQRES